MLRDARIDGFITLDLFDRDFFKPLSITDSKPSIDPYKSEEREIILEAFRTSPSKRRRHYYRFVFFQFWQGSRSSKAIALRREDVDLRYDTAGVHTKTVRSNREIRLRDNVVRVLSEENLAPLNVRPDDFLFNTPEGTPIEQFL
jgi:integrase